MISPVLLRNLPPPNKNNNGGVDPYETIYIFGLTGGMDGEETKKVLKI